MIDIVGMFPDDGRRLRRRTAPDDRCSTSRDKRSHLEAAPKHPNRHALQPLGDLWFGTGFLRFRFRAPILPGFAFILGSSCRETSSCRQLIEVLGPPAAQRALCRGRSETKSL